MKPYQLHKRYSLMLEVLIAFVLVALCVFPLISPHVAIYRQQREFVLKIELDQAVSNLYSALLEKLYRNEIPWSTFENGQTLTIEEGWWKDAGYASPLPFVGRAAFRIRKQKKEKEGPISATLLEVIFSFVPEGEKKTAEWETPRMMTYSYRVFIAREIGGGSK